MAGAGWLQRVLEDNQRQAAALMAASTGGTPAPETATAGGKALLDASAQVTPPAFGAAAGQKRFQGSRSVNAFLGGQVGHESRSMGAGRLRGLAALLRRATPVATDAGPLAGLASGGLEGQQAALGAGGLFVNRRGGSEREGMVGQKVQLPDGRVATVYYDSRGRRVIGGIWRPGADVSA